MLPSQFGSSRLSLRAKGVAVLSLPIVALFAALYWVSWTQGAVAEADRAVFHATEVRGEALQLVALGLDPDTPPVSIERSVTRLEAMAGGAAGMLRAAAERREQALGSGPEEWRAALRSFRSSVAPLLHEEDFQILQGQARRDAAEQRLSRVLIVCGTGGALGALLLHLLISGRLARRLGAVEENARRLANGLELAAIPPAADEIGGLERQIEEAARRLSARERELRDSEQRYRDLFDRGPVPYEETDREGVIRRFNREVCDLLKCDPGRVMGSLAWDFVAPDQRERFREAMLERMASGLEAPPFECELQLQDGSRLVVEIRENLLHNPAGEVTGVCRSLLDVTERKLASVAARKVAQYAMELRNKNEQLAHALDAARSATEAKSRFLASVSHELRTPLNSIIGFSELLYDGKLGEMAEGHREILADVLSSARHLLQIISDILDLSKVEAGRMEFHPERLLLAPLVQEVRDVIRPLAERKALRLVAELPEDFEAVLDPARFKQVLYNYMSNAVKFTPAGGRVAVRIVPAAQSFRLEVEDTGIGIPPQDISKLFQDFQQLGHGPGSEQGTGLGLALTRHIVEAQGGSVGVRSVPEKGSLFTATLPLNTAKSAGSASALI
jgi:PAS domain S-box-containing protein